MRVVVLLTDDGVSIETDGEAEFHILDFSAYSEDKTAYYYPKHEVQTKTPKQLDSFLKRWVSKIHPSNWVG